MSKNHRLLHRMLTKQERDERRNRPPYPPTKRVNIFRSLFSRDTGLGIYFFVMFQLAILLLMFGVDSPYQGRWVLAAMTIAVITSIHGMYEARKRQRVKFRVKHLTPFRYLTLLALTYLGVFSLGIIFNFLNITVPVQPNQEALVKILEQYLLPMSFITVVVAPIVEELVFREFLPHAFGPSYLSFIIFSIVFALLHSPSGVVGFSIYMFLSTIFLYFRLKDNNLMTSIYLHMGYNLISLIMSLL